jgi:thioredoxin
MTSFLVKKMDPLLGMLLVIALVSGCSQKGAGNAKSNGLVKEITKTQEFERIMDAGKGKLLVFDMYADWCAPCRLLEPILEKLASDNPGKALFYRINVDNLPDIARIFQVRAIPYVVFVRNKQVATSLRGLQPAESYQEVINGKILLQDTSSTDQQTPEPAAPGSVFKSVSAKEGFSLILETKPFILDVRTEKEFNSGHISGATLIPVDQIADRVNEIASHRNDTIFVYCFSGNRSLAAMRVLSNKGFKYLINLKGGIMDWKRNNLPLTNK